MGSLDVKQKEGTQIFSQTTICCFFLNQPIWLKAVCSQRAVSKNPLWASSPGMKEARCFLSLQKRDSAVSQEVSEKKKANRKNGERWRVSEMLMAKLPASSRTAPGGGAVALRCVSLVKLSRAAGPAATRFVLVQAQLFSKTDVTGSSPAPGRVALRLSAQSPGF